MPLTYPTTKSSSEPDIANVEVPEIEITPEMIDAGAVALYDVAYRWLNLSMGDSEYLAEKIIRAALAVRARGNFSTD
jgi:hypothetical protein